MIYVIGESHGNRVLHQTSARLANFMGVDEAQMLRSVVWLNLFETPGTDPYLTGTMVERAALKGDAILLLGRKVATGWGLGDMKPLSNVTRADGVRVFLIPHPSGRNRWWNDLDHRSDAELLLQTIWTRYGR